MKFLEFKKNINKELKNFFYKKFLYKYKIIITIVIFLICITFAFYYWFLHRDILVTKVVNNSSNAIRATSTSDSSTDKILITQVTSDVSLMPAKLSTKKNKIDTSIEKQLLEFAKKITFQKKFLSPEVFIVIDDFGYNLKKAKIFLTLEQPITFAILPNLPQSSLISEIFDRHHKSILLHMPMEPKSNTNIEKITLFNTDNVGDIRKKIKQSLATVPFRAGVSNHMGSAFINNKTKMSILMEYLKRENLFFLDSKTVSGEVSKQLAYQQQVLYYERDIFLDNSQSRIAIAKQLIAAVRIAYRRGKSIAIGHPYIETYQVLSVLMPFLQSKGIIFKDFTMIKY